MRNKISFVHSPSWILVAALLWISGVSALAARPREGNVETVVLMRHGEKTPEERGQLSCKGLNRALALPDVLIKRYGRPDFIFAPNPSSQKEGANGTLYSYVRPLVTIEPTAIRLGLPVDTQIGYNEIGRLQKELLKPEYAGSLIFVAWEHKFLYQFARRMLSSHGKDASVVPQWPGTDYDTIYVLRIDRSRETPELTFESAKEMLDGSLSDACPTIH
jgi:hypothetical protein